MKISSQKGFTLLEVLVVIAVAAVLMVVAGFYMGDRGGRANLKSAARDLISNINLARVGAIRDSRPWAILFSPGDNSYVIFNYSGEPPAPSDQVDWTNGTNPTTLGAEVIFRSVKLPRNVSFGSGMGEVNGHPVGDGVSYNDYEDPGGDPLENLVIFFPNGTSSESGGIYLKIPSDETYSVSNIAATGRAKAQSNFGNGWTH